MDNLTAKNNIKIIKLYKIIQIPLLSVAVILFCSFLLVDVHFGAPFNGYKLEVHPAKKLNYDPSAIEANSEFILVCLNKERKLSLNNVDMELPILIEQIKRLMNERTPDRKVVTVMVSKELPYAVAANLIDDLKGAGVLFIQIDVDHL